MPLADKPVSRNSVEFKDSISKIDINSLISNKDIKVLQTCNPVDSKSWALVNEILIAERPDIEIRIYGHYGQICDLAFLENITNVQNLSIDCLQNAINIKSLEKLPYLKSLSIGIFSLESFDFLELLPTTLEQLFLGATNSKKPNLKKLGRFSNLKELYIEGQQKEIEVVGILYFLEKLVLRSVSPKDISFIRKLENLWSLDIKLGGIKDLTALDGLTNIKYLELWQIKGLSDISVISSLSGLQYLFLQSLRNVGKFPDGVLPKTCSICYESIQSQRWQGDFR